METKKPEFKPLFKNVLLKRDDADTVSGTIIIPETYRLRGSRATIVAVGHEVSEAKAGEVVLFMKEHTRQPFVDRSLSVTKSNFLLARLEVMEGQDYESIIPLNNYVLLDPMVRDTVEAGIEIKTDSGVGKGYIFRYGKECHEVVNGGVAHYEMGKGTVECVENDEPFVLISEDDILCVVEK